MGALGMSGMTRWLMLPVMMLLSCVAHARGRGIPIPFIYGTSESIEMVSPTFLTGPDGRVLYIGRKVSTHFFLLPYSMTDDGLVIGVAGDSSHYYKITDMQVLRDSSPVMANLVDNPPPWRPSFMQQLWGHALWLLLAGLAASYVFRMQWGGILVSSGRRPIPVRRSPGQDMALLQRVAESRILDPQGGLKLGARQIMERLEQELAGELGPPVPTLLAALGALAGYACQASVRTTQVISQRRAEDEVFDIRVVNGERYFFAESVDRELVMNADSVWKRVYQALRRQDPGLEADPAELLMHAEQAVGERSFGVLRAPVSVMPVRKPVMLLKMLWFRCFPELKVYCRGPEEWSRLYALAIEEVLVLKRGAVEPKLALMLVMGSAVAMARVDLGV